MTQRDEKTFVENVKHTLDELERDLDATTCARLRAVRRAALAHDQGRGGWHTPARWLPAGALTAALAGMVIAAVIWLSAPSPGLSAASMEDLELLGAEDSIEFYADLDFYQWLTTENDAG
ncbi:MAG: DUF3619 family protein [Acidiferrobacterales bacterium]